MKGKKVLSLKMPAHVTALHNMPVDRSDANSLQIVALANRQVSFRGPE